MWEIPVKRDFWTWTPFSCQVGTFRHVGPRYPFHSSPFTFFHWDCRGLR
jgi:hypothetical protein